MTPHFLRSARMLMPDRPSDLSLADVIIRAVAGICQGIMPGARLEALLDSMETPQ